ncbi:MAG: hypothetical protein ACXVRH_05195 [Thermoleophilaceae bacterium]
MSQANVDKALAFVAAYNRRDFDAAVEHFDHEIDWVLLDPQEAVDAGDRIVRIEYFTDWPQALEAATDAPSGVLREECDERSSQPPWPSP